jgi:hypothetical protein
MVLWTPKGVWRHYFPGWALAGGIARAFPAPVGSVIAGGWTNGWFTVFFLVALATVSGAERRGCE